MKMDLERLYPATEGLSPRDVVAGWTAGLRAMTAELCMRGAVSVKVAQMVGEGIDRWKIDPDHGAVHSYDVYLGMRYLIEADTSDHPMVDDASLQAAAVLHDLLQVVPLVDVYTGETLHVNQRKKHPQAMALAIRYFGPTIGLDGRDIQLVADAVRHHDDAYTGKGDERLSYLGRVLSDADKLFGAGGLDDPVEMARAVIARNLTTVDSPEGWNLLRADLTAEDRRAWQYGDRWLSDRLCAVLHDLSGIHYYTEAASELGQMRWEAFCQHAGDLYGWVYDRMAEGVEDWMVHLRETGVALVGKEQTDVPVIGFDPSGAITQAFGMTLPLSSRYQREGFVPRGWMVQLERCGERVIVDPSVARFMFDDNGRLAIEQGREQFFRAIHQVVGEYAYDYAC